MREKVQVRRPPIFSYDRPITLDSLKYMKDRLIGALEEPEIIDKLGNLALGLCDTAQMLEPMKWVEGEELGDSHADPDWPDKNIIPLIGGNKFVFSGKQISPMPVQKYKKYIIENALLGDNSAGVCVDDMYRDIENYPTTSKEVTDVGGFVQLISTGWGMRGWVLMCIFALLLVWLRVDWYVLMSLHWLTRHLMHMIRLLIQF